jgi:selenocysteine lyase/cysteine desulfurase
LQTCCERSSKRCPASLYDQGEVKCGIVTFGVAGLPAEILRQELRARRINVDVSTPEDTRLDFEHRKLEPLIRASLHYYNTDEEISQFCNAVAGITRARTGVAVS